MSRSALALSVLSILALALVWALATMIAGPPTCEDLHGPEGCPAATH